MTFDDMNDSSKSTTELAVIGAGPGGYAAAFLGADLGLAVTLIDPIPIPGGYASITAASLQNPCCTHRN